MLAAFCCRNCLLSVRILFTWFIVPRRKRHSRKSFAVNVEWITHGKKWIYSIPLFVHSLHLPLFNKYLLVQMYVGTSKGTCTWSTAHSIIIFETWLACWHTRIGDGKGSCLIEAKIILGSVTTTTLFNWLGWFGLVYVLEYDLFVNMYKGLMDIGMISIYIFSFPTNWCENDQLVFTHSMLAKVT